MDFLKYPYLSEKTVHFFPAIRKSNHEHPSNKEVKKLLIPFIDLKSFFILGSINVHC